MVLGAGNMVVNQLILQASGIDELPTSASPYT